MSQSLILKASIFNMTNKATLIAKMVMKQKTSIKTIKEKLTSYKFRMFCLLNN
jgi:hypothetical protein